jgi:uncharacterized protein (TIGR03118 family)
MQRRQFVLGSSSLAVLSACGGGGGETLTPVAGEPASVFVTGKNGYVQSNLVATGTQYKAKYLIPDMVSAWGIAIRPSGVGGHFWVAGGGSSWQFIGDVRNHATPAMRSLTTDGLKRVSVSGTQDPISGGVITGIAFNGAPLASSSFVPTGQTMPDGANTIAMEGSARFVFVTDTGYISAWTDRRQDTGGTLRNDGATQRVYDGTANGSAFFGVAFKTDTWDTMWVADFGVTPQILQFDKDWNVVPTIGMANPFGTAAGGAIKPGDYVPFNITVVKGRVFIAYAKSRPNVSDITQFYAGEEDSLSAELERAGGFIPNKGRLVEYTLTGDLVRIYDDQKHLNAPWGVEIAPANFGPYSGAVLVGNFGGAGCITAFDGVTGNFLGYLRNTDQSFVAIEGLWALQFGNGDSLGDKDALYFAASPEEEAAGLFGSLRFVPA